SYWQGKQPEQCRFLQCVEYIIKLLFYKMIVDWIFLTGTYNASISANASVNSDKSVSKSLS
ncbi:MAG: hypothetical protein ACI892_002287, partial [Marinobacter maritimus]